MVSVFTLANVLISLSFAILKNQERRKRNLPEIADFGFEVSSKKYILRFEVSMDDLRVAFMHEVYCLGDVE